MPGPFAFAGTLGPAAELDDAAAVALAGPVRGQRCELLHGFTLVGNLETCFAAGFGLAVKGLCHRRWASDVAHAEDIDLEAAGIVFDLQAIAGADVACRFGAEAIRFDPAQIAGARGHGAGLEEARRPEPFVDANGVHSEIQWVRKLEGRRQSYQGSRPSSSATGDVN